MFPAIVFIISTLLPATTPQQPGPDPTMPNPANTVVARVQGRGVQVYRCSVQTGGAQWTLAGPDATLFLADGTAVGRHTAGPTWTWRDGSALKGNLVATKPAPQSGDAAWLLLQTSPSGNTHGLLSGVLWVRRSETHGGVAPHSGCDSRHENAATRVPYTATYTFYGSSQGTPSP